MGRLAIVGLAHTSKIVKGHAKAFSLRITIPKEIAKELGYVAGDTVEWAIAMKGGKKGVFIRKLE